MRTLTTWISGGVLTLALATTAFAKGGTPQNHHCVKDGADVPGKTHKECTKDGGKWEKDAPKAAADAPKTDAPAKAAPTPAPAK